MSDPVLEPISFVRVAGPLASVPWVGRGESAVRPIQFRRVGEPFLEVAPSIAQTTGESTETRGSEEDPGAAQALDPDLEARLADVAARERALDEDERRLRERELEIEEERARLVDAIATLATTRASVLARAEGELLDLATGIAGAILGAEIDLHPAKLARFVEAGLAHLGPTARAVVRLSPAGAEIVRARLGDRFEKDGTEVRIEADPSLEGLGCVISGDTGMVDVRVEERLARVRAAMDEERNGLAEDAQ